VAVKLTCVVDNTVLDGRLWGEHGLSLLIESRGKRVLYDCGGSGDVLLHNLKALAIDPRSIDAIVLSHGHTDHAGGLAALAAVVGDVPLYAHPEALLPRYTGTPREAAGTDRSAAGPRLQVRLVAEPTEVAPGIWTSGEVRSRPYPEGRGASHVVPLGDGYAPDPYRDDTSLFLSTAVGTVVVCGCAHAGLLNVMELAGGRGAHLAAIVGGTHLIAGAQAELEAVADYLEPLACELYVGHCTGFAALTYLARRMPERTHAFGAGWSMQFPDAEMGAARP
jgi:7,8-dihydropterin-6-yl-methyl-4-(beta-D-ribofuranosyl)aminobenzene 5'-phosphate synthase